MLVLKKEIDDEFEPLETILENSTFYDGDDIYEVFQKDEKEAHENEPVDGLEKPKKSCCCCCWCCYFLLSDFFGFS